MTTGIKITADEMRYIALFEQISGASVKDCIIDEEGERVIFIVNPGQVGVAIGKGGRNIHQLERMTSKKQEIIEYSEDPVQFIKNALKPAAVREVRVTEKTDGKKIAVVTINPKDKGVAIGKNGKNAERLRFLAKRYFDIQNVSIS
ncbi:MAG TPA: NusA-like transcription termination signal-binding factor [Candidatus Nanoarchaeia archaeon]|nr:NusA-like transcription termination signal-binding factor [Candidatus Nanoarchaeia archaeon]